ncbi:MAG TPA: GNAT family N-acetyltransferase [Flavipsychrobacter sp.]|nr:GNAT family N-acetyltransferase [Flavipsychrobacter sp.]
MKTFIETERLILRELLPTDVDGMFELDSDPEVHRYIGNKPVTSKQQVIEVIDFIRQQYKDNGIGRWAIIDKKANDFMGWSGLKFMTEKTNNLVNYYDLGYRLKAKYWGQGYATETAFAFLEYAFEQLNTEEVYAMANVENAGSNNVLRKAGLKLIETFDFEGIPHNWYKIAKKQYLAQCNP